MRFTVLGCLLGLLGWGAAPGVARAQDVTAQAQRLERSGEVLRARALLARAADANPRNVADLRAYAQFLDRYNDPARRDAYQRWLRSLNPSDRADRAAVARRLVLLDLIAGEREAALQHLEEVRRDGGSVAPEVENALRREPAPLPMSAQGEIQIPGPLRSFERMAALSSDLPASELLAALARNIITNGYQASHSNEALEQTEYLKLVNRYLSQARELAQLASKDQAITITTCDSNETGQLIKVLGFRLRTGCGDDAALETVNASRAFLTIDSGFPVAELEEALRKNQPFRYEYKPTKVPVMFGPAYWMAGEKNKQADFIDVFLGDPALARLYLAFSKLDPVTVEQLRKAYPLERWKAFAHVLDFFGGRFELKDGKIAVPGGQRTAAMWAEMVGAPPDKGAEFIEKLISRDDGWMASFFDALSRSRGPLKDYLTEPARMKRFYLAVRGRITSPGPARPVFRSNADMMLLTSRLQVDPNGQAHIPGGLEPWKQLFAVHPHGKYDGKLTRAATSWRAPDDVVEALFALCRKSVENEPLKIFMAISDIDRNRKTPLHTATVQRLAMEYHIYGSQYALFNDAPSLSDETILSFLDTAGTLSKIKDPGQRSDTVGTFQALVSLWQVFVRQGEIAETHADASLKSLIGLFNSVRNDRELFDAGRAGVKALLAATGSREDVSPQDRIVDLLAGKANPGDQETHRQVVTDMSLLFETQRLVSLKTLFDLADHLESVSRGEKLNVAMTNRLASRISEIRLPRTTLTNVEKNSFSFGYWTEKHVEQQRALNLRQVVDKAAGQPEKLKETRGLLAPILRDTLVGFSYIYYAPPGAQIIRTNPLFVRSHDFLGVQNSAHTWRAAELFGTGWPSNGGGRLLGSLAGLAYAEAEAEQNFLVPTQTQALIWGDLVPQIMLTAKVPRWWQVTPNEQHWLALHLRLGSELLARAAVDPPERGPILEKLGVQVPPARRHHIARLLENGNVREAIDQVTPSELYLLARNYLEAGPPRADSPSPIEQEIHRLAAADPAHANPAAISRAFGAPHPTLANSYRPELLNLPTFPTLMGYSSRILAESWESNNLYWAALADELHLAPAQLNVLIPQWTEKVVERIFATHLEDWPAVLRSLRMVGDDYKQKARPQLLSEIKASLN
ncbi:MAG TPA: hypothetical protein VEU62_01825 [Bryobacterales bacterium]|nr:hypothetical protein [Bryobacterales bacterium]